MTKTHEDKSTDALYLTGAAVVLWGLFTAAQSVLPLTIGLIQRIN